MIIYNFSKLIKFPMDSGMFPLKLLLFKYLFIYLFVFIIKIKNIINK